MPPNTDRTGVKSAAFWKAWESAHVGVEFVPKHKTEDACRCPQQPCGLIRKDEIDPDCEHHGGEFRSFRQNHMHDDCPGPPKKIRRRRR